MSKETFKRFVRSHPSLVSYVNTGDTTWQKLYEMYDLYGENNSIWNSYFNNTQATNDTLRQVNSTGVSSQATIGDTSLKDIFNMIKSMDLDTVKKGVDGLQKAVLLLQDFTATKKQEQYQARPLYKHLED